MVIRKYGDFPLLLLRHNCPENDFFLKLLIFSSQLPYIQKKLEEFSIKCKFENNGNDKTLANKIWTSEAYCEITYDK